MCSILAAPLLRQHSTRTQFVGYFNLFYLCPSAGPSIFFLSSFEVAFALLLRLATQTDFHRVQQSLHTQNVHPSMCPPPTYISTQRSSVQDPSRKRVHERSRLTNDALGAEFVLDLLLVGSRLALLLFLL